MVGRMHGMSRSMMKTTLAILLLAASIGTTSAETIAQCRARSNARQAAGMCGAHGCDCGMTTKECRAARGEIQKCIKLGMDGGGMYCVRLINECIKGN